MYSSLRFLLLIAITLTVSVTGHADQQKPRRLVARPPVWDLGFLPQKSEISRRYYLVNIGTTPVTIDKIKAGCSCTSVSSIDQPIPPGDSAALDVLFKSGRYHHRVKKTTRVYTENSGAVFLPLTIKTWVVKKGEVSGHIKVEPQKVEWTSEQIAAGLTDTVQLLNRGGDPLTPGVLFRPDGIIKDIICPPAIPSGQPADLILKTTPSTVSENLTGMSISLRFTGSDTTIVTIPITIKK